VKQACKLCHCSNSPILKLTSATAAVVITLQQVDSFRREQRRKDRERERARPSSGSDSRQQQRGEASSKHRDDAGTVLYIIHPLLTVSSGSTTASIAVLLLLQMLPVLLPV
jgi:hypothetical protein